MFMHTGPAVTACHRSSWSGLTLIPIGPFPAFEHCMLKNKTEQNNESMGTGQEWVGGRGWGLVLLGLSKA